MDNDKITELNCNFNFVFRFNPEQFDKEYKQEKDTDVKGILHYIFLNSSVSFRYNR